MKNEIRLSVIIVNWNAKTVLLESLKSIYDTVKLGLEIIVVDNNSSDGSVKAIRRKFPHAAVIEEKTNLGFSKANNLAFGHSMGEYLLFLNPDTIVKENAIDNMVAFLQGHPEIGMLGPRIINGVGLISFNCKDNVPTLFNDLLRLFLFKKAFDSIRIKLHAIPLFKNLFFAYYDETGECRAIEGSCMLMRRSDFELLGGFSEDVPMFLDDLDLAVKCMRKGLKVFYLSTATIVHIGQQSVNQREDKKMYDVMYWQARIFYYRKHFGMMHACIFKIILFLSVPYLLALDVITLPLYIMVGKLDEGFWIIRKHLKYLDVVFSPKIINVL